MYEYSIFIIFGILLYLFLNGVDRFSIGVPDHEHRNERQLGTIPNEPAPMESLNKGDIVKLTNNIEEHNLVENDHGVITDNTDDINYEVQIFRPIREITTNLEDVRRRLILSYATQNHRLLSDSPLNIIPQDLLLLIINHFNYYERRIGTFRIPQINLRLDLSPINILTDIFNPSTKYSCMSNGRCIETEYGNYNSEVECEIDCIQKWACASMRFA